ncbi:hypothetical protein [Burkholderia ubonensis]|uniref:Uncharacterized protein n=1 Tax=Burkholderia ubonensis TaxID=101571 RepID=A0A125G606_9BURK|nr:hypothetical protein [Burkholderia ubonensis]KWD88450.1 hypothetical protein WL70_07255 [Burkholderia ubonensis]KWD88772.1 hypothetical protein WL72_34330 [Burkholderia ubonensis]KWD89531.1 hypothetical protein WL71_09005 [Burkholderia ubonensis]KWD94537.1 hypothetical protein WL73_25630 [Burkholderia ubonensis]
MSSLVVNSRQRVLISHSIGDRSDMISISVERLVDSLGRTRHLNIRAHLLDDFIDLLLEEREILNQRNAGGA